MVGGDGGIGMRYTRGEDWVEIEGAADTPMAAFDALYAPDMDAFYQTARDLVAAGVFHLRRGGTVEIVADSPWEILRQLSKRQLIWLRERIMQAMRDEELDPEV